MADKFRSLLPQNALHQERALEQAGREQILALATGMVRRVKSADGCPFHLLPWLAWELSVDFWDENWTEEEKRQVCRDAAYVHQHRGTAGAVRRALGAVSLPTTVIEWWQENPRRAPYTFRIEVFSLQGIDDSGASFLAEDGNVYGPAWGGYLSQWVLAQDNALNIAINNQMNSMNADRNNCVRATARGGRQHKVGGDWIADWEAPAGCFMTGMNTNEGGDGRKAGLYFRAMYYYTPSSGWVQAGDIA